MLTRMVRPLVAVCFLSIWLSAFAATAQPVPAGDVAVASSIESLPSAAIVAQRPAALLVAGRRAAVASAEEQLPMESTGTFGSF